MTSPDLPTPVSLTLHAVNETNLVNAMLAALQVNIPEWVPQEGATEVLLMESIALVMGQQIYALNQLPRIVMDGVIAIRGYQRHQAIQAAGQVQVTVAATSLGTRTLPIGARFRIPAEDGGTFDALAAETVEINPTDSLNATINVIAEVPGSRPNGVGPPVLARMLDAFTWIETAMVSEPFTGGSDTESDVAFYSRVAAAFQASSTTLVIDSQYGTAALAISGVGRAKAFGLWDGVGSVGAFPGHITVAISAADGSDVTPSVKAQVEADLSAKGVAGIVVHVIDFTRVTMPLVINYTLVDGADSTDTNAAIEATLRDWIDPATWRFGETLTSVNQIILRIGRVDGVDNVTSVTGWLPVTGTATLPLLSTVTCIPA